MVKEDKKEGKKKNIILWERAVLFGALIVVGIWKREKVKEIWKIFHKGRMPGNHFRSSRHVL